MGLAYFCEKIIILPPFPRVSKEKEEYIAYLDLKPIHLDSLTQKIYTLIPNLP